MLKSKTFTYQKINHKDSENTGHRVEKKTVVIHIIKLSIQIKILKIKEKTRFHWKREKKYKQFPYEEKKTSKK